MISTARYYAGRRSARCWSDRPGVSDGCEKSNSLLGSVTWNFAVGWFAHHLGANYFVGTRLLLSGDIEHFWPEDKANWLATLASQRQIPLDAIAAVGDSAGDVPMLRAVGHPFFVGRTVPEEIRGVPHYPEGDIGAIIQNVLKRSNE